MYAKFHFQNSINSREDLANNKSFIETFFTTVLNSISIDPEPNITNSWDNYFSPKNFKRDQQFKRYNKQK